MKKPEIAFVSNHTCIRAKKQAIVLRQLGYNIHLVGNMLTDTQIFQTTTQMGEANEYEKVVKGLESRIDIWHIHNEPNWPVISTRKVLPNAKIVMDHHDSHHWRTEKDLTFYDEKEKAVFYEEDVADLCADAFVVPSKRCQKELKTRTDKEVIFIPSACPKDENRLRNFGVRGGLCSQGGHVTPEMSKLSGVEKWRDYTELYQELKGKIHIFTYSPNYFLRMDKDKPSEDDISTYYQKLGVVTLKRFYHELLDMMGEHTWNLVGNWWKKQPKGNVWNYALPNKLFDGIAAGVPPLIIGCPEASELISEYDIGMSVKHPIEIVNRWGENIEKRKNLLLHRDEYALENYIEPLVKLYEGL